ncbi:MAG: hypothetical protein ACKO5K_11215, partial [Armatimonadota bacterium]
MTLEESIPGALVLTEAERTRGLLDEARLAWALKTFRDSGILAIANAYDEAFVARLRSEHDA